ncbi:MAG TPA: hypothetical protein VMI34_21880 [Candidatus Bathyarchaeia archaeon]|nr:hypothetical protein [Candidatus Bathyarchaeia archaeon]
MKKPRAASAAHPDFDLTYRPDYWQPSDPISLIIANVKGEERRRYILDVLEGRHTLATSVDMPSELLEDSLPENDRIAWGNIAPGFMGGEYLPDYARGEIEIARVVLDSTLADVTSIRARRTRDLTIHYRVVDEYQGRLRCRPRSTRRPLTLAGMISLVDSIEHTTSAPGRSWVEWVREMSYDPEITTPFLAVESPFYRQLGPFYEWRDRRWRELRRATTEGARGDATAGEPSEDAPREMPEEEPL